MNLMWFLIGFCGGQATVLILSYFFGKDRESDDVMH